MAPRCSRPVTTAGQPACSTSRGGHVSAGQQPGRPGSSGAPDGGPKTSALQSRSSIQAVIRPRRRGVAAQPCGLAHARLVQLALARTEHDPGDLGQQADPPGAHLAQRGHRGGARRQTARASAHEAALTADVTDQETIALGLAVLTPLPGHALASAKSGDRYAGQAGWLCPRVIGSAVTERDGLPPFRVAQQTWLIQIVLPIICSCPSASAGRAPRPEQPAMVTRWPLAASAVSSMDPGFTVRAGDGRRFGRWACLVAPLLARQQGVTRHIGDRRSCAGRLGHRKDRAAP